MPGPIPVGRKAPAFAAPDQSGNVRSLAEFRGRAFVLYFYPKDDTAGCTVEACSFRDAFARFRRAGIEVLGVSPDPAESHARFVRKLGLPFALLADQPAAGKAPRICSAYGAWQEKSMYGRKYMGVARTTYLVGPDGRVAARFEKVKPDGHADEILAAAAALPSAACRPTRSTSVSGASAPARRSPRTKASTPRASTSTHASRRR